jgi:hypothetical protein
VSATFAGDGATAQIVFNIATDQAGYSGPFACSNVFSFVGAAQSYCSWFNSTVVAARFGGGSSVATVNSKITVLAGVVRAYCDPTAKITCTAYPTALSQTVLLRAPKSGGITPTVVIVGPSRIGGCASLSLDLSRSTGAGGSRPWLSASIRVNGTASVANLASVQSFISGTVNVSAGLTVITVASKYLNASEQYGFQVTLCNFLGGCSSAYHGVAVDSKDAFVPIVSVAGQTVRSQLSMAALQLISNAYIPSCDGATLYSKLAYNWTIVDSSSGSTTQTLTSVSKNPTIFQLAGYSLTPSHVYVVTVTATHITSHLSASAAVTVQVGVGALMPVISGGSNKAVRAGVSLLIDATASYDQDLYNKVGTAAGLSYTWTIPASVLQFVGGTDQSSAQVLGGDTAVNTTNAVTVTISKDSRSATGSVLVSVVQASAPVVTLTTSSSTTDFVVSNTLILSATVTTVSQCYALWSVSDSSITLPSSSSTAVLVSAASSKSLNLVIVPDTLSAASSVTFSLSCGRTTASVTVVTNSPPTPGLFTVDPSSGSALTTTFALTASQWSTDNTPLSYQFFYVSGSGIQAALSRRTEESYVSTILSVGSSSANYAVSCVVHVYDSLGSYTTVSTTVTVSNDKGADSTAYISSVLTSNLAQSSGNVEAVKRLLVTISSAVNTAQCDEAPDCNALNRQDCTVTANTCGSCVSGYVGASGNANTMCVSVAAMLQSGGGSSSSSGTCSSDADCLSMFSCDLTAQQCVADAIECNNDCSGHGDCVYLNVATRQAVSTCLFGDGSCTSQCVCSSGFHGDSCNVTTAELANRQAVRDLLLESLATVASSEDASDSNLKSWSDALSSMTQVPCELSSSSMDSAYELAETVLTSALANGVSSVNVIGVLGALDNVLSAIASSFTTTASGRRLMSAFAAASSSASASSTLSKLSMYGQLTRSGMVAGSPDTNIIYSSFRLTSSAQSATAASSSDAFQVSTSLTSLESVSDMVASSASMSLTQPSDDSTVSVSNLKATTISLCAWTLDGTGEDDTSGTSYQSNLMIVEIEGQPSYGDAVDDGDVESNADSFHVFGEAKSIASSFSSCSYETVVVLPNSDVVEITPIPSQENFTTYCSLEDYSTYYHTCSITNAVLNHTCARTLETIMSFCPDIMPYATCANAAGDSSVCRVVAFTSTTTTCACTVTLDGTSTDDGTDDYNGRRRRHRRLSGAYSSSGAAEVVSMSVYVAGSFVDTFRAAGSFNSLSALQHVLIVIIMFAVIWFGGLTLILSCVAYRASKNHEFKIKDMMFSRKTNSSGVVRSKAAIRSYLVNYVAEIFPSSFREKPLIQRLQEEICKHHRYLLVLTAEPGKRGSGRRIMKGIQLLTIQTMLMFLLCVFYEFQGPANDGTCTTYTDKDVCLHRKSPLDVSQTYCRWAPLYGSNNPALTGYDDATMPYQCEYNPPNFSWFVIAVMSILISIVTALVNYPIDFIFSLLVAPTVDAVKASKHESAMARTGRRVSEAARRVSAATAGAVRAAVHRGKLALSRVGQVTKDIPDSTINAQRLAVICSTDLATQAEQIVSERAMAKLAKLTAHDEQAAHKSIKYKAANLEGDENSVVESDDDDSFVDSDDEGDISNTSKLQKQKGKNSKGLMVQNDDASSESDGIGYLTRLGDYISALVGIDLFGKANREFVHATNKSFASLRKDIDLQRSNLKDWKEMEQFDSAWGIDPTGEFFRRDNVGIFYVKGIVDSAKLLWSELLNTKRASSEIAAELTLARDEQIGLEMLHLFVIDLLGKDTAPARIFANKVEEDFETRRVVSRSTKYLAWCSVIAINMFFVYYTLLHSYVKGVGWQRSYLIGCVLQFVVEITLNETLECLWVNCFVPSLVANQVHDVSLKLTKAIDLLCNVGKSHAKRTKRLFLDAPSYLFVSTNLAAKFPTLLESMIIRSYSHHLPGPVAYKWKFDSHGWTETAKRLLDVFQLKHFHTRVISSVMYSLQVLGASPFVFQRVFIRLSQPWLLASLTAFAYYVGSSPIAIGVTVAVAVLVIAFLVRRYMIRQRHSKTADLADDEARMNVRNHREANRNQRQVHTSDVIVQDDEEEKQGSGEDREDGSDDSNSEVERDNEDNEDNELPNRDSVSQCRAGESPQILGINQDERDSDEDEADDDEADDEDDFFETSNVNIVGERDGRSPFNMGSISVASISSISGVGVTSGGGVAASSRSRTNTSINNSSFASATSDNGSTEVGVSRDGTPTSSPRRSSSAGSRRSPSPSKYTVSVDNDEEDEEEGDEGVDTGLRVEQVIVSPRSQSSDSGNSSDSEHKAESVGSVNVFLLEDDSALQFAPASRRNSAAGSSVSSSSGSSVSNAGARARTESSASSASSSAYSIIHSSASADSR